MDGCKAPSRKTQASVLQFTDGSGRGSADPGRGKLQNRPSPVARLFALVRADQADTATVVAAFARLGKMLESYYDLLAAVDKFGILLDLPLERMAGVSESSHGSVLIDGEDLAALHLESLRETVMLLREPEVHVGTLLDNLSVARPSATRSEIEAVVVRVGLGAAIAREPTTHSSGNSISISIAWP